MLTDYLNINTHAFTIPSLFSWYIFIFILLTRCCWQSSYSIQSQRAEIFSLSFPLFLFRAHKLVSPTTSHLSLYPSHIHLTCHLFHILHGMCMCLLHFPNTCKTAGNKCKSWEKCYTVAHRLKRQNRMVLSMCPKNVLLR